MHTATKNTAIFLFGAAYGAPMGHFVMDWCQGGRFKSGYPVPKSVFVFHEKLITITTEYELDKM
jgi:hypothetical protein